MFGSTRTARAVESVSFGEPEPWAAGGVQPRSHSALRSKGSLAIPRQSRLRTAPPLEVAPMRRVSLALALFGVLALVTGTATAEKKAEKKAAKASDTAFAFPKQIQLTD